MDANNLARQELIGLGVRVSRHPDPSIAGCEGTVVDETMNTLSISCGGRERVVQKRGGAFEFRCGIASVELEGSEIAFRPEDRTKKAG
jgi:RNase P/RNase MRP subunit p29